MPSRLLILTLVAGVSLVFLSCGGHGGHEGTEGMLGAPAKGGLDVTGNALFVALGKTGEVAVIDVDGWKLAGKVKLSASYYPHHLDVSPDRKRVAVAAPSTDLSAGHGGHATVGGGALFVLDSRTGDVVAQKAVSGTAHNLAYVMDGSVLVYALSEHNVMHFADSNTLAEAEFVEVGVGPLEATPVPGTKTVLVSNSGAGTVSVVDATSKKVTKTVTVGSNPIAVWIGSKGLAFVTSEADKKLSVIDLTTLAVTQTVTLLAMPGQARNTSDGKEVWVAYEDQGSIGVLGGNDLVPVAEVTVGTRPHGLALSAGGSSFFVTDETTGKVHEVDIATRTIKRSLDVGGAPNGIVLRTAL